MRILGRALGNSRPRPTTVLSYDDRADAVVDVFLPDGPVETLVVFLHGGFWRQRYDRTHVHPLAGALGGDGFAVALPEYRRVGGGGGWPTTCLDVQRALTELPGLLAGIDVRPTRTVLTGHSAGGHLTLWLAANGVAVDAAVPLAPVGDLRAAAAMRMGDGAVQDFLGGDDTADRIIDQADPAVLLGRARPAYPITILHGTADDVVTIENSRGLVARHPWIGLVELPGADHFSVIDPEGPAYADLLAGFGTGGS